MTCPNMGNRLLGREACVREKFGKGQTPLGWTVEKVSIVVGGFVARVLLAFFSREAAAACSHRRQPVDRGKDKRLSREAALAINGRCRRFAAPPSFGLRIRRLTPTAKCCRGSAAGKPMHSSGVTKCPSPTLSKMLKLRTFQQTRQGEGEAFCSSKTAESFGSRG